MSQRLFALFLISSLLVGCAIAPLSTDQVARSYGKNKMGFSVGMSSSGIPDGRIGGGLTKDWDIWGHTNLLGIGLGTRYSFINRSQGLSVAGLLGFGSTFGGSYYYAGPVVSYKTKKWEPYLAVRYNYANVDEDEYEEFLDNIFDIEGTNLRDLDFAYAQLSLGSRFWFHKKIYAALEANLFKSFEDRIDFASGGILVSVFIGGSI